jgi:hypothetical protein
VHGSVQSQNFVEPVDQDIGDEGLRHIAGMHAIEGEGVATDPPATQNTIPHSDVVLSRQAQVDEAPDVNQMNVGAECGGGVLNGFVERVDPLHDKTLFAFGKDQPVPLLSADF